MICCYRQIEKVENIVCCQDLHCFLLHPAGPVESLGMRFLIPEYGSGDIVDDSPRHLPDDIGL